MAGVDAGVISLMITILVSVVGATVTLAVRLAKIEDAISDVRNDLVDHTRQDEKRFDRMEQVHQDLARVAGDQEGRVRVLESRRRGPT
jgi:hypothetical protein